MYAGRYHQQESPKKDLYSIVFHFVVDSRPSKIRLYRLLTTCVDPDLHQLRIVHYRQWTQHNRVTQAKMVAYKKLLKILDHGDGSTVTSLQQDADEAPPSPSTTIEHHHSTPQQPTQVVPDPIHELVERPSSPTPDQLADDVQQPSAPAPDQDYDTGLEENMDIYQSACLSPRPHATPTSPDPSPPTGPSQPARTVQTTLHHTIISSKRKLHLTDKQLQDIRKDRRKYTIPNGARLRSSPK